MMFHPDFYCVILAGGTGLRLWPSSSIRHPKQFIDFLGTGETLLQMTYRRYLRFVRPENILVVSNQDYEALVRAQLPSLASENLLLEPMRRNTIPSVIWAAFEIHQRNPSGCMVVSPSDQLITNEAQFEDDVLHALDFVGHEQGLLTMGVSPTRPETAYGYIQMGDLMNGNIYKAQTFTEKPSIEFASLFYQNGEFLWNTGLYVWSAAAFLQYISTASDVFNDFFRKVAATYKETEDVGALVGQAYPMCPNVSIEKSLLERMDHVGVMHCHFGWADLGTWDALYNALPKADALENVVRGDNAMLYDCNRCLVSVPDDRLVIADGLSDLMVVEAHGVLVICRRDDEKAIRKFVNDVQINKGDAFL
jgi:mannose-1-phosphate guanylyltransferase